MSDFNSMFTPTSAQVIADYLLWLSNESGSFLSNLKLQKLLYYAQGWHMGLGRGRLFNDQMQAWVHGPAIPAIYRKYKKFSFNPISQNVRKPEIPGETEAFLGEFAKVFFPLDAYYLELATYRESPWINARGDIPLDAPCKRIISESDMVDFFSRLANGRICGRNISPDSPATKHKPTMKG